MDDLEELSLPLSLHTYTHTKLAIFLSLVTFPRMHTATPLHTAVLPYPAAVLPYPTSSPSIDEERKGHCEEGDVMVVSRRLWGMAISLWARAVLMRRPMVVGKTLLLPLILPLPCFALTAMSVPHLSLSLSPTILKVERGVWDGAGWSSSSSLFSLPHSFPFPSGSG